MKKDIWFYFILVLEFIIVLVHGQIIDEAMKDTRKSMNNEGEERPFRYRDYEQMVNYMKLLERKYPQHVQLSTAQDEFGLQSPGMCGVTSGECKQWIMRVTNRTTYIGAEKATRPQVFFSGEIHGDERVGPQAMIEMAAILAGDVTPYSLNPWIRFLLNHRVMVFMPMANSLGYYQKSRSENNIDTNRDYPIDQDPTDCMQTITSRAINELFKSQMFQLALTFHGGMQAIALEWGTFTHNKNRASPDDIAQLALGTTMSAYAGSFEGKFYPHGRINDLVYPVNGGMEDWAYAANWDTVSGGGVMGKGQGCESSRFGGYDAKKTQYTDDQLRIINILIETSDAKTPKEKSLGTTSELFRPSGKGDGHVPRNIRLALLVADLVQPYIQWSSFSKNRNTRSFRVSRDCSNGLLVSVGWEVGGSIEIDETLIVWGFWPSEMNSSWNQDLPGFGLNPKELANMKWLGTSKPQKGLSRWAGASQVTPPPSPNRANGRVLLRDEEGLKLSDVMLGENVKLRADIADRQQKPFVPAFVECLRFVNMTQDLFIMVRARVDGAWKLGSATGRPEPNIPPQSHYVNARTNTSWEKSNNGFVVKGQEYWFSTPIRIFKSTKPNFVPPKKICESPKWNELTQSQCANYFFSSSLKGVNGSDAFEKATSYRFDDSIPDSLYEEDDLPISFPYWPFVLPIFLVSVCIIYTATRRSKETLLSSSSTTNDHNERHRLWKSNDDAIVVKSNDRLDEDEDDDDV